MRLITKILNANDEPVNFRIHKYGTDVKGLSFEVRIYIKGDLVGYMQYSIHQTCLYIHRMNNYSVDLNTAYKHVGSVLFEYAFHKSIQNGKNGCIELDAINNSPAAYYQMGLRKKGMGAIWLQREISEYQTTKSLELKKTIKANPYYVTLKADAEAMAKKKGLTTLSFEEILEYGEYSLWNDKFAERLTEAKLAGKKLSMAETIECYMDGVMYLPAETIAAKKIELIQFVPIGSNYFFSKDHALSKLKNPRLIELVESGKLDSSNAVEIEAKISNEADSKKLLELLLSPLSLKMIRKNYISAWFAIVYFNVDSLKLIISENMLFLFENNHIGSISQLIACTPELARILSDDGVKAFKEGTMIISGEGHLQSTEQETLDFAL